MSWASGMEDLLASVVRLRRGDRVRLHLRRGEDEVEITGVVLHSTRGRIEFPCRVVVNPMDIKWIERLP